MVELTVGAALEGGCRRVLLVVGFRGEELVRLFRAEPRVLPVWNRGWEKGMLGSIQEALPSVEGGAFFSLNADMPAVDPSSFGRLEAASREAGGEAACFAAHGGAAGHPVLIPSAWIKEILGLAPGSRMKAFLAGKPSLLVECGPGSLLDLDTPGAYEAYLATMTPGGGEAGS
jgi:molybdenum cofactor cytidylyltransferase